MQPDTIESMIAAAVERAIPIAVERYLAAQQPANTQQPAHGYLTVPELAQRLRCSERQAWRLLSLRLVRASKVAGKTLIAVGEAERYERVCRGE